ncbi:MAG: prolyl oligopeptidase family serine peptidase [Planctomycetota bacterium]
MTQFYSSQGLTAPYPRAFILLLLLPMACAGMPQGIEAPAYPDTRTVDQVDIYHGVEVRDPYRWLEEMESDEVRRWVEAQNAVTLPYIESISEHERIERRLTELWNYERCRLPEARGGRIFFRHNEGLGGQDALYVLDDPEAERRLLLDPNRPTQEAELFFRYYVPSNDGHYVAYSLSPDGTTRYTWRVLDVETGTTMDDIVHSRYEPIEWAHDGAGFYYPQFDVPHEGSASTGRLLAPEVWFHRLGTPQSADELILTRPEDAELVYLRLRVSADGRFLLLTRTANSTYQTELTYLDLQQGSADSVSMPLIDGFDAVHRWVGNDGDTFFVQTNLDAPNWKIVAVDRHRRGRDRWRVVVPEGERAIVSAGVVADKLTVTYLKDVVSEVHVFGLDGMPKGRVELNPGMVSGFRGGAGEETYYALASFTEPDRVESYNVQTGRTLTFFEPNVAFKSDGYETRQVFYESKDGTRVPMFLSYRKGLKLDGSNPTYLTGYGAFGISATPRFYVPWVTWMEMGGVLAVANVRGGGEYGDDWRKAGSKRNKQNTIDDMLAAAEWLCEGGYTSRKKLAFEGSSAGGLLAAACLTQRPDLFGAVVVNVALADMLRFEEFTIGSGVVGAFGSVSDSDDFRALHAYSPLHNVRPGTVYPPTLILTSEGDDMAVPCHSYKFAAALQAAQTGPGPVLLRVEANAGHTGPTRIEDYIREVADTLAFLCEALDFEPRWDSD